MSRKLYCKNIACYDIDKNEILDMKLIPNYILMNPSNDRFNQWVKLRYSAGTNTYSRMLRGAVFGQGNRQLINEKTFMLSYTDCYWVKDDELIDIKFEEVSPYYARFWDGQDEYKGEAIPTLYTPGYLSKEWRKNGRLFKEGNLDIELDCIELCKLCGVSVENGYKVEDGIELENFTSADIMLVTAEASGMIDSEDFTDEDVQRVFGIDAVKMQTIDAIIGNGDRHAGNFGFLKDSNTGEIIGMSPLYDFDHALDDRKDSISPVLLRPLLKLENASWVDEVVRIAKVAMTFNNALFAKRAEYLFIELFGQKRGN